MSASFNKLKLLAEELKATDYTLTQSSLDQARIVKVATASLSGNIVLLFDKLRFLKLETKYERGYLGVEIARFVQDFQYVINILRYLGRIDSRGNKSWRLSNFKENISPI